MVSFPLPVQPLNLCMIYEEKNITISPALWLLSLLEGNVQEMTEGVQFEMVSKYTHFLRIATPYLYWPLSPMQLELKPSNCRCCAVCFFTSWWFPLLLLRVVRWWQSTTYCYRFELCTLSHCLRSSFSTSWTLRWYHTYKTILKTRSLPSRWSYLKAERSWPVETTEHVCNTTQIKMWWGRFAVADLSLVGTLWSCRY